MARRRVKRTVKQPASSDACDKDGGGPNELEKKEAGPKELEKNEDTFNDQEIEQRSAAIRAIRDMEIEQLLTGLRLLRSYVKKEQLQTPVLQFFEENLPNLSVLKNGKDGQYEVQWKDRDGNLTTNEANGRSLHASLLHRMSIVYPGCSASMPSLGGFEFPSEAVKASILGADNLQIKDFVLEESSGTQMLGLQDGFQTPGVSSHRMSVGVTPQTLRLPKHGEMLLSVHGSPLGVYKEDNMEAIRELDED